MPIITAQAVLPYVTGLPRDVAVNTFHFFVPAIDSGPLEAIRDTLIEFYNDAPPTETDSIGQALTAYIDRTTDACEIRLYDAEATGGPLGVGPFTLVAPNSTPSLPFEVALCLSFAGSDASVLPAASKRGRVYLGPLLLDNITAPANLPPRPSTALIDIVTKSALRMATSTVLSGEGVEWVVWSRRYEDATVVQFGWVDNEFDTQRRRQVEASVRYNWTSLV